MHVRKKTGLLSMFLALFFSLQGQVIHISLLNEVPVKGVIISSLKGTYQVICDSTLTLNMGANDAMYVTIFDQRLLLRNSQNPIGNFASVKFQANDTDAVIRVSSVNPKSEPRQYSDDLSLSVAFSRILIINDVQPNNYIAGVVDAEAGPNAGVEFYKAQSILVRTYLYGNINRHIMEGFQLCDGVHCQAYKGRAVRNPVIAKATKATSGFVVLAEDSSYINAVFHANCGGETESGANAWLSDKSYLVPVKDPFCINSQSAKWNKSISLDQWKKYLRSHGFTFSAECTPDKFEFSQVNRKQYYKVGKDSIPFKQIRTDLQLKSSFFSISANAKEITLNGRGFGHGVGLCQDGAMYMAKIGYKFEDILNYYFKGIKIVYKNQFQEFSK
jgi:stage II sporulation protein D